LTNSHCRKIFFKFFQKPSRSNWDQSAVYQ